MPESSLSIAEWLDVAGEEKAVSVTTLAPSGTKSVVEIGCGTGAILKALDRSGFANEYWACEPADELREQVPVDKITRIVEVSSELFEDAFPGKRFDLVILSHVLEHLLSPAALLNQAIQRADYVLVEVPLEANFMGLVRHAVKKVLGRSGAHAAGHVQFFSRRKARDLVKYAGGRVIAERGYFPRAPYAVRADNTLRRAISVMGRFDAVGKRYYEHFAMLVEPRVIELWDHHYYEPV